jgi:two-component system, chemotaxis family, protein-glutamate methylesterase/glutaminase
MESGVARRYAALWSPLAEPINEERVTRDIVTLGASAGGVEALRRLFASLPHDFPGVISAVIHRSPVATASQLPEVLAFRTSQAVAEPESGERFEVSRIYVAPRDQHLLIEGDRFYLDGGPKQHHARPAIDPLFESAAASHGPRVVGVILSGGGHDGVSGLKAIKAVGGISIAQDPLEAASPGMPESAISLDDVDLVLPVGEIAGALVALASGDPLPSRDA